MFSSPTSKFLLRTAAGGAAGAYLMRDRGENGMMIGASFGLWGGALAPAIYRTVTGSPGRTAGRFGLWFGEKSTNYVGRRLGNYFRSMPARYSELTKAGVKPMLAGYKAYGRWGMFAAAGALIGMEWNRQDPAEGAVYGTAIGLGAKAAGSAVRTYTAAGHIPLGRTGLIGLAALGIFGAGRAMRPTEYGNEAMAVRGPEGMEYQYGVRDRMSGMSADGDLVFGLNSLRHG